MFHYDRDVKQERRAFITTAVLFAVTMLTFLPYSLLYLISYNGGVRPSAVLVMLMNVCPYAKCCSEPLVYGIRTPEVRRGASLLWKRVRRHRNAHHRRDSKLADTQSFFSQPRGAHIDTVV